MNKVTDEESFLFQSYALAETLFNLSEMQRNQDNQIVNNTDKIFGFAGKDMRKRGLSVFGGQGALLSILYMLLVIPREWNRNDVGDFDKLDLSEAERAANTQANVIKDTYPDGNQALKHLRNALAHGRIGWECDQLVVKDKWENKSKNKKYEYKAKYSRESVGIIAQQLCNAIFKYFQHRFAARG